MACAFPTIASSVHQPSANQPHLKCFRQSNWPSPMSNQSFFSHSSINKPSSSDQNEEFTKILDFSSLEQDILKNVLDDELEEEEAESLLELDTFPSFNYAPAPLPSIFKRISPIMKLYPEDPLGARSSPLKKDGGLLGSLDLPPISNSFNIKSRAPSSQTSNAAMLKAALQRHTIDASWPGINVANHNGTLQRLILPDTFKTHQTSPHDNKMSFTYKEAHNSMATRQNKPTSIAMLLSKLSNNYHNSFSTTTNEKEIYQQRTTMSKELPPQYSYKTQTHQPLPTAIAESVLREDERDFLVHSCPTTPTTQVSRGSDWVNNSSRKTFAEIVANARLTNTAR